MNTKNTPPRTKPRRKAAVLLTVLVVVVLLSLAAYKFNDWMTGEYLATDAAIRSSRAKLFAMSGVNYATAQLAGVEQNLGGNPFDNPGVFQDIEVPSTDQHAPKGRFSIVSLRDPNDPNSGGQNFQYGAADECGKINVNALLLYDKNVGDVGYSILMALPNMTDEVANAILDWIDTDQTPRGSTGAESEYYSGLNPPYRCKDGPLDSLEELLLVKGVTPELLFGADKNRNGVIDADEGGSGPADMGWSAHLTVYSREMNMGSAGTQRVNINDADMATTSQKITAAAGQEISDYISAYRLYGGSTVSTTATTTTPPSGEDLSAAMAKVQEDITAGTSKPKSIRSFWKLVNSQVSVKITLADGKTTKTVVVPSPLNDATKQRDILPKLFDLCATSAKLDLTPRVNINTASPAVITAMTAPLLPNAASSSSSSSGTDASSGTGSSTATGTGTSTGTTSTSSLTDADVQTLISMRPQSGSNASDPIYKTPTWMLTEANLKPAVLQKLETYFTTQSQVYRIQAIGYFDKPGPTARMEAVIDTNMGRPRILYLRDLSELGTGFDVGNNKK